MDTVRNNAASYQKITPAMEREMERLFAATRGVGRGYILSPDSTDASRGEGGGQSWTPAVDVVETAEAIVLHAELPGMKKEEIDIQLSGDMLAIRGERSCDPCAAGANFHRIERRYGRFSRTFQLETSIDAGGIQATYDDGVLTVKLPKTQAGKARQIPITSS